jgi:dUTP pyrophosphatase
MQVKYKRLTDTAQEPTYATAGAACFDLYADIPAAAKPADYVTQGVGSNNMRINTGLAFDIPEGWAMLVFSRSGQAFKDNVRLANCVGVIDSDYTGEVLVKLARDDFNPISVSRGDRIAQAMLVPVERVQFVDVTDSEGFKETERGANGLGSTGK